MSPPTNWVLLNAPKEEDGVLVKPASKPITALGIRKSYQGCNPGLEATLLERQNKATQAHEVAEERADLETLSRFRAFRTR